MFEVLAVDSVAILVMISNASSNLYTEHSHAIMKHHNCYYHDSLSEINANHVNHSVGGTQGNTRHYIKKNDYQTPATSLIVRRKSFILFWLCMLSDQLRINFTHVRRK